MDDPITFVVVALLTSGVICATVRPLWLAIPVGALASAVGFQVLGYLIVGQFNAFLIPFVYTLAPSFGLACVAGAAAWTWRRGLRERPGIGGRAAKGGFFTNRPIAWLSAALAYSVLVAPLFLTKARPGGPLISILGELTPFLLNAIGIAIGLRTLKHQSMIHKAATVLLILGGTAIIALVLLSVHGTYRMGRYRIFGL